MRINFMCNILTPNLSRPLFCLAFVSVACTLQFSAIPSVSGVISVTAKPVVIKKTAAGYFLANERQNFQLPMSIESSSGQTSLATVGQFESIGNPIGKFSTLTTVLAQFDQNTRTVRLMSAGYQVKGQKPSV